MAEPPTGKIPKKRGRKRLQFDDSMRGTVEAMAGYGLSQEEMAALVRTSDGKTISVDSLIAHFSFELMQGSAKANVGLLQLGHQMAMGRDTKYDGAGRVLQAGAPPSERMVMFLLERKAGMRPLATDRFLAPKDGQSAKGGIVPLELVGAERLVVIDHVQALPAPEAAAGKAE